MFVVVFWTFVIAFVYVSLIFSFIVLLACLTIVYISLLHCLLASDVEIGVSGLRSLVILSFVWIGFRA